MDNFHNISLATKFALIFSVISYTQTKQKEFLILVGVVILIFFIGRFAKPIDLAFEKFVTLIGKGILRIILIFGYYFLFFPLSFLKPKTKYKAQSSTFKAINKKITKEDFNKQW